MADSPQPGNPLLTQLTAAVTSIVTIVGLFVLTGVVGRVQRNFPTLFAIAVGAVVVGSAFIALSPLLHGVVGNKHAWLPAWLTIIGSVLVPLGVILTVVVAVSSAHRSERPVVTAAYDPTATATRPFTGTVKVADLSSNARVLFVNYAAILPDTGPGCWPQMPITEGDVPYVRAKQKELNAMMAQQAAANGAELVDWYTASIGHHACRPPVIRWVEPAVPVNAAAPLHPNLGGMIGASELLTAALR